MKTAKNYLYYVKNVVCENVWAWNKGAYKMSILKGVDVGNFYKVGGKEVNPS